MKKIVYLILLVLLMIVCFSLLKFYASHSSYCKDTKKKNKYSQKVCKEKETNTLFALHKQEHKKKKQIRFNHYDEIKYFDKNDSSSSIASLKIYYERMKE